LLSSADLLKDFHKGELRLQIRFFLLIPLIIREKRKCKVILDANSVEEQSEFSKTKKRRFMFQCEKFIKRFSSFRTSYRTIRFKEEVIKIYPGFYKLGFDNYIQCKSIKSKLLEYLNRKMVFHRMRIAVLMFKFVSFYSKLRKMKALFFRGIPDNLKKTAFQKILNFSVLVKKVVFIQRFLRKNRPKRFSPKVIQKLANFLNVSNSRNLRVINMEKRLYMNILSSQASEVKQKY
jgi:hypothetical protein